MPHCHGRMAMQDRVPIRGLAGPTGEAIKIKASKKIAFRPAKELKEAV